MNGLYFFSPYLFPAVSSTKQEEEEDIHSHGTRLPSEPHTPVQNSALRTKICSILRNIAPNKNMTPQSFTIFQFRNSTVHEREDDDAYKLSLPSSSHHLHHPLHLPFYPLVDAPEVL